MGIMDSLRRLVSWADPELDPPKRSREPTWPTSSRAMTPPIYHMGEYRRGIISTEQQTTPDRLLTDGFSSTQATAARAISSRLSDLEFRIQQEIRESEGTTVWEDIDDHAFLAVLDRPNTLLSRRQMLKLTSYWLSQTGEAFWLAVTNGAGATKEFWPMSPRNIEKLSSDIQPVSGFVFHGEGGEIRYGLEEVVWIFDPDPADPFAGVGIVGPQAREFDASTFASSTMRSHFQHDATPKVVLKADGEALPPDKDQREAFWADWKNRFNRRGGEDMGVPAFLPSGFDVKELVGGGGVGETIQLLEFMRDQLLMANGVPRSVLGDVVDANRAAADTNRLVFDRHTIKPQAGLIADALTQQVVVPEFGAQFRVRFEQFISEDEDLRLREEAQDLTLKVRSINQVRVDRGLDPVDWGDEPIGTFGDQPYTPDDDDKDDDDSGGTVLPFPQPADDEDEEDQDIAAEARVFVARVITPRIAARLTPEAEWSRVMQTDAVFVPRMLSGLRRVFAGQKALTLAALRDAPAAQRSYSRADWLDDLFDIPDFSRLFDTIVTPISVDVYQSAGENALLAVEERPQLLFNELAVKEMREQGAELVTLANATTKRRLRSTISKGIEQGESLADIEGRVRSAYNTISKGRARTIARTEVGFAMSKGQLAGFQQSETTFLKKWNTALDDRVRDQHQAMQSVIVAEDGVFMIPPVGKKPAEGALAPRISATGGRLSAHNGINCRCFDTAVLGE